MAYIKTYDNIYDEVFQCEINDKTTEMAIACGCEVSDVPFDGIPIKSRFASERRKERNAE